MINDLKVLGVIPARGSSKRIPRKNVNLLAGKPLISYTIDAAKASKYLDRVILSSDDAETIRIAKEAGIETPFTRPAELAGDEVTDLPVFEHTLAWLKEHEDYVPDIVVQLRPTSPLRTATHIDDAIELLAAHPEADSVRTVTEPEQSPYKMFKIGEDGLLEPLLRIEGVEESFNLPGQKLPKGYKHVGYVDALWSKTITEKHQMTGSKIVPLVLGTAYSGINTPEDWERYEYLLSKRP